MLTFEEYLKAKEEYNQYVSGSMPAAPAEPAEALNLSSQPEAKPEEIKPEAVPQPDAMAALMGTIEKLNTAVANMQSAAITHSRQPEPESVDQILASIINPPNSK